MSLKRLSVDEPQKEYLEVQRFTGPGDMGRDVVGYLTRSRHEGPWHNYQCKQYGRSLQTGRGLAECSAAIWMMVRISGCSASDFSMQTPSLGSTVITRCKKTSTYYAAMCTTESPKPTRPTIPIRSGGSTP
jgi:hypothetical protein